MTAELIQVGCSLLLLFAGAEALVRGSASLALRLGLTPLLVGLTVVSFGTSAPEMLVSVQAATAGKGDLAVANVIGSNILNLGIILGLTALVCPIPINRSLIRFDAPVLVGASILAGSLIAAGLLGAPAGIALLLLLLLYTGLNVRFARRDAAAEIGGQFADGAPVCSRSAGRDGLLALAGLGALAFGARLLVAAATQLALDFGVSEAVIGLTIVALGTSLPELVTCLVAAWRGQPDIAAGNAIGSSVFNLLGILGLAALLGPVDAPNIHAFDLIVMAAFAAATLPLLWTGLRLR
ncbi:MAG: calcium/sodium antiporter, partial [Verrucomicrobiae bacterium]|nr:calcium/sodium antiporter [Verrucomicrobiae bacterium]